MKIIPSALRYALTSERILREKKPAKRNQIHAKQFSSSTLGKQVQVLNIQIDNLSQRELLKELHQGFVVTPNVDHLMKLQQDKEFLEIYNIADYRICDSKILFYASKFLGTPLKEKISGSDFFPAFCDFHRYNEDIRVFFLGGGSGVAKRAMENVNRRVGREIVVGAHSPSFGFEQDKEECMEIIQLINSYQPTVLAVGVGAPKQEKWIHQYRQYLPSVKIFLPIGATIDFEAGKVSRAPKWVSELGFEWLYRLMKEPSRLWKRYLLDDVPFFWLILKQKFGIYKSPF